MSDETTGCADDNSPLSQALRKIAPERLNELLCEELPDAHGAYDVFSQAAQHLRAKATGGTFTVTTFSGVTTEPIAFDATEAEVQAAVDEAIAKHKLQLQVPDGTPSHHEFDLHCACGSKETITVSYITDLYRVLNEKGYVLIPTQHGRIVQVVCPDCHV